jgi:hypothetical protein
VNDEAPESFPDSSLPQAIRGDGSVRRRSKPEGLSLGAFLAGLFGAASVFLGAALILMAVLFMRERRKGELRDAELAAAHDAIAKASQGAAASRTSHPELPTVQRHVPAHSLLILEGCSPQNLEQITDVITDAIGEGAPLYNEGDFAGCYRTYVAASLELEHVMPKTCAGPVRALATGRSTAKGLDQVAEQAWAMRDAFDGLLEVIARSEETVGGANL